MPETLATVRRAPVPTWVYRTGSILLYAFLTCLIYGFDIFNNSKIIEQAFSDQVQEVWFLAWPAYAVVHGANPFVTDWMNHPYGVNMMTNTSMPLLGFLGMPITWIFGPVVTYTLLMRTAMVTAAMSMQFVARRIGLSRPASLLAGLLYGFSTIQITHGYGHLFLDFCALPPLILYGVYCLVIGRWDARKGGVIIGALFAADFLISAERALMTAIVLLVVGIVAVIFCARLITREFLIRFSLGGLWALGVALAILIIPLLEMQGHGHVSGASHPWIQSYETDLYSVFFPSVFTWLHLLPVHFSPQLYNLGVENGAYVGIPLLVLLGYATIWGWRSNRLLRIGAVSTVIITLMSVGEVLKINGRKTSLHSPYKILTHVKYVENILPIRFMYFVWIGVALIGAFGLDMILRPRRRAAHGHRMTARARALTALVVVGLVALTLWPARPNNMVSTDVPAWLLSPQASQQIPTDSVVLNYPYPLANTNHAMLNQAVATFPYKIIGGEAIVGDVNGKAIGIVPLTPLALPTVFIRANSGVYTGQVVPYTFHLPPMPKLDATTVAQFREFVVRNHVSTILMEQATTPQGAVVLPYLTAAFGQPDSHESGTLLVWTHEKLAAATSSG